MRSWGTEFGYELIDEDWKLKFKTPDPELAKVVTRAVENARLRQRRLAAAAPRSYRNGAAIQYRAGRSHGIVPDGMITRDEKRGSHQFGGTSDGRFGSAGTSRTGTYPSLGRGQAGAQTGGGGTGQSPYDALASGRNGHGTGHGTGQGNGRVAGR